MTRNESAIARLHLPCEQSSYDPDAAPTNLRFAEFDEPVAGDFEAIIDVRAIALNFGEVRSNSTARVVGRCPSRV